MKEASKERVTVKWYEIRGYNRIAKIITIHVTRPNWLYTRLPISSPIRQLAHIFPGYCQSLFFGTGGRQIVLPPLLLSGSRYSLFFFCKSRSVDILRRGAAATDHLTDLVFYFLMRISSSPIRTGSLLSQLLVLFSFKSKKRTNSTSEPTRMIIGNASKRYWVCG